MGFKDFIQKTICKMCKTVCKLRTTTFSTVCHFDYKGKLQFKTFLTDIAYACYNVLTNDEDNAITL